ncbi:hypothetical protein QE152_g31447 [Popillia japonica]|uniref:Uncharacterized protein n=1 Tax=Popillia japonica TaxID=7064 RepID=A0AAW1J188_POPJA
MSVTVLVRRVAPAYRTVPEPVVLVAAGVMSVTVLVRERRRLYLRTGNGERSTLASEERAPTMKEWQTTWQEDYQWRWIRRLIQRLKPYIDRRHGGIDIISLSS